MFGAKLCFALFALYWLSATVTVHSWQDITVNENESNHILDRINTARKSRINVEYFIGINETEANQIASTAFNAFYSYTTNIANNSCINSTESQSTTIYAYTNCYYDISVEVLTALQQTHPSVRIILGESFYFSNYNTDPRILVTFWLGPLYFILYL